MNSTCELNTSEKVGANTALKHFKSRHIQLSTIFSKQPNACAAKKTLNTLLDSNPEYANTILALVLYPVFKWAQYGEVVGKLIDVADGIDWADNLTETKQLLHNVFGGNNSFQLNHRKKNFALSKQIIRYVEECLEKLKYFPDKGITLCRAINTVINVPNSPEMSYYEIKKYLPKAIKVIHQYIGNEIEETMAELTALPDTPEQPNTDEYMFAYHNMRLLIREYSRLLWANGQDKFSAIMKCKSENEVYTVTEKMSELYSADTVLTFLLLITGSIALIKHYPINGDEYAEILQTLVGNRNVVLQNGECVYLQEQELAEHLGISGASFSIKKRKAFALLGLLLWGYDQNTFFEILLEKNTSEIFDWKV